ncbi:hypothetical protein B0O80DRAFT_434456 [Mortierella sp. GBAus27b]|nr:hypothetical protein B0O80DRAFT_434456 [Mortierella sp. GBAus27b]
MHAFSVFPSTASVFLSALPSLITQANFGLRAIARVPLCPIPCCVPRTQQTHGVHATCLYPRGPTFQGRNQNPGQNENTGPFIIVVIILI